MVHIKKLEVFGFKSFGFKNTVINFEKGLVAITGPNGSGKSNILDAIMFAIGETSPKVLRVDKFQSLFHDSQQNSTRLIRTSLYFDNADRGIPVDSDSVVVTREMEGQTGESQYYLNKKRVTKGTLTELLEIVLATSHKLNIIQQGMITRISELDSEDRRKIIEDIIGLSYFDEKKNEAMKQLEESDRRLDIAMARIDEIRKQIDSLEEERNDQLRYKQVESDLQRFRAVKISNNTRAVRSNLQSRFNLLNSIMMGLEELDVKLEEVNSELEKLGSQKLKLIQDADAASTTKTGIGSAVSRLVYDVERKRALIKETNQKLDQIQLRYVSIETEKQSINSKLKAIQHELSEKEKSIKNLYEDQSILKSELTETDSQIDKLSASAASYTIVREKFECQLKSLNHVKNFLDVSSARVDEKVAIAADKIRSSDSANFELKSSIARNKQRLDSLSATMDSMKIKLKTEKERMDKLKALKSTLQVNLESANNLLSTADGFTSDYEIKAATIKNSMSEDVAIAELMKTPTKFGIAGLVYQLVTWDKIYERPILAAAFEWTKAFVVNDVKSMILLAAYAKKNKFPRLKVIPLDLIRKVKRSYVPYSSSTVVGRLADFANCDHKELSDFLFGNTLLVKTPTTAYFLSRKGYKAVTFEGELFEPLGSSMSADFGSKISDLTHTLLLSDSIIILRNSLSTLKKLIEKKGNELKQIAQTAERLEHEKFELEKTVNSLNMQFSSLSNVIHENEQALESSLKEGAYTQSVHNSLIAGLEKLHRRLAIIELPIEYVSKKVDAIGDVTVKSQLERINAKRGQILSSIDDSNLVLQEALTASRVLRSEIDLCLARIKSLEENIHHLESEQKESVLYVESLKSDLVSMETSLQIERDREQQIIISAGSSVRELRSYDEKIRTLQETEKKLSKEHSSKEREIALIKKDIATLESEEFTLLNDLRLSGYEDLLDSFDVNEIVDMLTVELDDLKSRINQRADHAYIELIEGYRGMSEKRNLLEAERHTIVRFIEEIATEKNTVFTEALERVDNNLRQTFSEVTGGSAWLEPEYKHDEFPEGIMLMVQFQGKPGRESSALSGGEKTMAAIVFLLALQSLKPSPFYLMDEVDAHLDAQNTERLSKVLLQRSKENQMIMVTLKDATVAEAGLIYGVYSHSGVSQVIRYKPSNKIPHNEISV